MQLLPGFRARPLRVLRVWAGPWRLFLRTRVSFDVLGVVHTRWGWIRFGHGIGYGSAMAMGVVPWYCTVRTDWGYTCPPGNSTYAITWLGCIGRSDDGR